MKKDIHIGTLIKEQFEKSGLSIQEFARSINRTRTTIYDIFNRKSIDVDLLMDISEVLHYPFLEEVYLPHQSTVFHPEAAEDDSTHYLVGIEVTEEQLKDIDTNQTDVVIYKKVTKSSKN
jgi:plasmid maintenance system antidote protein VapI